ncbi:GNAT family N-acetyltransferase [Chromobacterium vaccinii]|uniref:GNAT family N-acetyltransferase n=1 Tax=Chromobacterium vaccinii TaxID=1108595 RepID=UPI0009F166E1
MIFKFCWLGGVSSACGGRCGSQFDQGRASRCGHIAPDAGRGIHALVAEIPGSRAKPGNGAIGQADRENTTAESTFYLILRGGQPVGGVRVVDLDSGCQCRISPIFILSAFQRLGVAQQPLRLLERWHRLKEGWCLDSIVEEVGNCRLYEKLGFIRVGPVKRVQPGMHLVSYRKEAVSCA